MLQFPGIMPQKTDEVSRTKKGAIQKRKKGRRRKDEEGGTFNDLLRDNTGNGMGLFSGCPSEPLPPPKGRGFRLLERFYEHLTDHVLDRIEKRIVRKHVVQSCILLEPGDLFLRKDAFQGLPHPVLRSTVCGIDNARYVFHSLQSCHIQHFLFLIQSVRPVGGNFITCLYYTIDE